MILLTDEELYTVLDEWGKNPEGKKYDEEVAKAQLKKVWDNRELGFIQVNEKRCILIDEQALLKEV